MGLLGTPRSLNSRKLPRGFPKASESPVAICLTSVGALAKVCHTCFAVACVIVVIVVVGSGIQDLESCVCK